MRRLLSLLKPRYWKLIYNTFRLFMHYGPDGAVISARRPAFRYVVEESVRKWREEFDVLLAHRYTQLVKQLKTKCAFVPLGDLLWHEHGAQALVALRILAQFTPSQRKGDELPHGLKLLWELYPHLLAEAPEDLQKQMKLFGQDFARATEFAEEVFEWEHQIEIWNQEHTFERSKTARE